MSVVVVVDHPGEIRVLGLRAIDLVQKADELLMSVILYALANDLAVKHVERCEQVRSALMLAIVDHGAELYPKVGDGMR